MKNTSRQIEEAYAAACNALTLAYGQSQTTPDGKMCWMGRIDRAYEKSKANPSNERIKSAIKSLEFLASKDFADAERKRADYVDACKSNGIQHSEIEIACECSYCQRIPNGALLLFAA